MLMARTIERALSVDRRERGSRADIRDAGTLAGVFALPFALGLLTGAYLVWAISEVWYAGLYWFSLGTRGEPADSVALVVVTGLVAACWLLTLWAV
ncbi:hypothetical protein ACT17_22570 [Mycolicibacterium conceptionense]|uniref:Transmembrane protein n=1 Tax=Mycolicibacterium conceptionense TaxID=451644 RepID=A0A0J8U475_9MYCO|nr:hypothetical protein ACT17_22570 [Mycolicibacterium conceptionense]